MNVGRIASVAVMLVLISAHSVAEGRTVILKSVKDSSVMPLENGNTNRGDDGRFDLNANGNGGFVQFDLSGVALASGESISGATLQLYSAVFVNSGERVRSRRFPAG